MKALRQSSVVPDWVMAWAFENGVTVRFDESVTGEATVRLDGTIRVGPKFFDFPRDVQQIILWHEYAHATELDEQVMWEFQPLLEEGGGWYLGQKIPTEVAADVFASYKTDPEWLKANHPRAYDIIKKVAFPWQTDDPEDYMDMPPWFFDRFWTEQTAQYPEKGPPGISYFKGDMGGGEYVDCLLHRDEDGYLNGVLNHYPFDFPPHEQKGNVNVMVPTDARNQGIGTALIAEADRRWDIDWDQQTYTQSGLILVQKFYKKGSLYGGPFFHGTNAVLQPGDVLVGAQAIDGAPTFENAELYEPEWVYMTKYDWHAHSYARTRAYVFGGEPRVYEVKPLGEVRFDPEGAAMGSEVQFIVERAEVLREVTVKGVLSKQALRPGPKQEFSMSAWGAKTAAFADVQQKAADIRRQGGVSITRIDAEVLAATVLGDHGSYDVVLYRQDPSSHAVSTWECTCFPPGTLVTMADGAQKPIEEVRVGDEVITHLGNVKRVVNTTKRRFVGDLVRASMSGMSSSVEATPDHRFWTSNSYLHLNEITREARWARTGSTNKGDVEIGWKAIEEVNSGDYLSMAPLRGEEELFVRYPHYRKNDARRRQFSYVRRYEHPGYVRWRGVCSVEQKSQYFEYKDDAERYVAKHRESCSAPDVEYHIDEGLAFLLGWYTAEGFLVKRKWEIGFALGHDEWHVAEELSRLTKKYFDVEGRISHAKSGVQFRVSHSALYMMAEELVGHLSYKKRLARGVLTLPLTVQKSFLDGWVAGDGSVSGNRMTLSTVSRDLAYQGRILLARLGWDSSLRVVSDNIGGLETTKNARPIYTLRWGERNRAMPNRFIRDGQMWHQVSDSELVPYDGFVYDIEVEDDHSFQANGVNVHNCPWADYVWGRQPRFKHLEGRMCSHALATLYEAQARWPRGEGGQFTRWE